MVKKWAYFILVVAFGFVMTACNEEQVQIEEGNGGFLWKAVNGDTEVYLQGTIHLGTENFYPLNKQSEEAYEQADVVLPEIDLTDLNNMTLSSQLMMEKAMYPGEILYGCP